jgi:hypothetical protein
MSSYPNSCWYKLNGDKHDILVQCPAQGQSSVDISCPSLPFNLCPATFHSAFGNLAVQH